MNKENKITKETKKKKKYYNYVFLGISIATYILAIVLSPQKRNLINRDIMQLFWKILPVLILIFVFMFLMDIFFPVKRLTLLFKKGRKSTLWGITIVAGIVSTGSIYLWYPLLKDLQSRGMSPELTAVFIFNRAIKLQLLPIMIFYFGLKYVVLLTVVMVIFSLLYGLVFKLIYELK